MVYGPLERAARLGSLNPRTQDINRLINGSEKSVPATRYFAWVDVRDAAQAQAHVSALEAPPKDPYEDRLISAGIPSYAEVCYIIKTHFPHLVNSGLTPNPAGVARPALQYSVDNSKSVCELGIAYRSFETCIVDLIHSLLGLERGGGDGSNSDAAPVSVDDRR